MVSCTLTTHKWTKKEIESEILELSKDLANCGWFEKGHIVDRIKHWSKKLQRYEDAKSEFN